jgi:hypothetical protein
MEASCTISNPFAATFVITEAQKSSYLRLRGLKLGHSATDVAHMHDGVVRLANGL